MNNIALTNKKYCMKKERESTSIIFLSLQKEPDEPTPPSAWSYEHSLEHTTFLPRDLLIPYYTDTKG